MPLIDTEVQRAGVDVRWTIVAPREPSLNPDARRWLSSPHVKHIASVPLAGMDAVYATHDLLVFPSRFEGFGIAVLEAMKAGVVPVAARLKAGLPEMIDDGVSGFLIEPGDSTLAAGRISLLSADQGRLDAMSAAARQSSNQRFDANSCAEAITAAVLSAKYVPPRAISPSYLSRLDRPWIPNRLVRLARRTRGRTLPPELPG